MVNTGYWSHDQEIQECEDDSNVNYENYEDQAYSPNYTEPKFVQERIWHPNIKPEVYEDITQTKISGRNFPRQQTTGTSKQVLNPSVGSSAGFGTEKTVKKQTFHNVQHPGQDFKTKQVNF
jgi:hypothetical protein